MKGPRALARRYARAILDVASAQGAPAAAALRGELATLARSFETHAELKATLLHRALTPATRRRVVSALAEATAATLLLRRLLALLAERDRLELLPEIAEALRLEWNARQGVASATVVSASPLDAGQREALAAALSGALDKKIEIETREDPSLLGGLLVRAAGRTYDGTVRSQLASLRRRLAAGR